MPPQTVYALSSDSNMYKAAPKRSVFPCYFFLLSVSLFPIRHPASRQPIPANRQTTGKIQSNLLPDISDSFFLYSHLHFFSYCCQTTVGGARMPSVSSICPLLSGTKIKQTFRLSLLYASCYNWNTFY